MEPLPTPTYLRNHAAVLAAFGYWPSFHDGPLLSFDHSPPPASTAELLAQADEMTQETDERGYFGSVKNHLIRFRFGGVTDVVEFPQFVIPNTLFELVFSPPFDFEATGRFTVRLQSVMSDEHSAEFSATSGEVISVTPCNVEGTPI